MRPILIFLAMLTLPAGAVAAGLPGACPSGKLHKVRISEITSDGSLDGFRAAFNDHARWYASHGYANDRLTMSPVVSDSGRNRGRRNAVRVMTIHSGVSNVPREKQDAAWKAFAGKYKANSRIVSTTISCAA